MRNFLNLQNLRKILENWITVESILRKFMKEVIKDARVRKKQTQIDQENGGENL